MPSTYTDRLNGILTSTAVKPACRAATTANITLYGEQTIDGTAIVAGDRVLVKNQTTTTQNGIWLASATAWARALDFDGARDAVKGTIVLVTSGTLYASSVWTLTTANPITIGTSSIAFSQNPLVALQMTSTTSNAVGTGAKTFTTQTGLPLNTGQFILIADSANAANYMYGQVTSYSGTTLIVSITAIGGSGTKTSWNIFVSNPQTAPGDMTKAVYDVANIAEQLVGLTATQTLTNKTITKPNIIGTIAVDNAAAGSVGEYISSTVLVGAAVSLVTATAKTVTSISLTPGDWDVWGNIFFAPNAATTASAYTSAIHTTDNTLPTFPGSGASNGLSGSFGAGVAGQGIFAGQMRQSISVTTTIYLVAYSAFAVNTMTAYGFIGARRIR